MTKKTNPIFDFFRTYSFSKIIALIAGITVVTVGALFAVSRASGFFASSESETGSVAGNASIVSNAGASGGKAVQFNAPAPPPSGGGGTGGGGTTTPPPSSSSWPDATNTGYEPTGVTLHACASLITVSGTYDSCQFNGGVDVRANNVRITRSLIKGQVAAYSGDPGQQSGLVISDTTINCGCQSQDDSHTPVAIDESNYTLLRVNLYNSGHGAAVRSNVVIQDTWIHGLGGNTEAHKDGIFSGDGTNVTIKHNNIECNDGPLAGCTSAIGLLSDFGDITYYTIDNNLLNTNGASCFYGSGGPQKPYAPHHITFTNNHFGRAINGKCGDSGPVSYWDSSKPGMVWSGNVWDDTGAAVSPTY